MVSEENEASTPGLEPAAITTPIYIAWRECCPPPTPPHPEMRGRTHVSSGILVWSWAAGRRQRKLSRRSGMAPRSILHVPVISEGPNRRDVRDPCHSYCSAGVPVQPPPCCWPCAPSNGCARRQLCAPSCSGYVIPRQPLNPLAKQQQPQI